MAAEEDNKACRKMAINALGKKIVKVRLAFLVWNNVDEMSPVMISLIRRKYQNYFRDV